MAAGENPIPKHPVQNGHAVASTNGTHHYDDKSWGSRLLPMVADQLAVEDPHKIYASVAKTSNIADGFRDVTILELTNAVNFMAWWLEEHFGRSDTFETIAYMGVSDIRYNVVFLAAVKCGYKLLIPSLRNSVMMNTSLFKTTGCTKIFYSEEVESRIRELEAGSPSLESHLMFPLDHMMKEQWRLYPYNKDFKAVEKDPILVCHTSGSTGKTECRRVPGCD
ncbi:hypothetical protein LTR60_000194 [Cryomyces antarcticus]|nr:hypothetical protein LTR60_000194 [Cryomyces antarcticus]